MDKTALSKNAVPYPIILSQRDDETQEICLSIVFKTEVLMEFGNNNFCKCLSSLIALYFIYNIPFHKNNEKVLGFLLESIDFTEPTEYETIRSVSHQRLLEKFCNL